MTDTIGRYEIKKTLGKGGMATVYLAHDPHFERDVAVKVLSREFLQHTQFEERFRLETKTVAGLEHSAILPVYDYGVQDGQPFLVMRYMPGGSLGARLKSGPLPLDEIMRIVDRLAAALDRAHEQGIIHRDVKPGNIMFDGDSDAYLGDFGIARLTEGSNMPIGTPAYMAPELADTGGLTHLVDIYALGIITFMMLVGEHPYEADTPSGYVMAHLGKPVPNVHERRAGLPDAVQTVIERAMAKDPMDRYQSAGVLAKDLRAALAGSAVAASPVISDAQPVEKPTSRRRIPVWVWAIGAVLLLLLIGGAVILANAAQQRRLAEERTRIAAEAEMTAITKGTATSGARETAVQQTATTRAENAEGTAVAQTQTANAQATANQEETLNAQATQTADHQTQAAMTAVANAYATATVEAAKGYLDDLMDGPIALSGRSGTFRHRENDFAECWHAGVNIRDFVAEVEFDVPYSTSVGNWDAGFLFRNPGAGNNELRLTIRSDRDWVLQNLRDQEGDVLDSGRLSNLRRLSGESNKLTLVAVGSEGYFFLNDELVSQLPLDERMNSGNIAVCIGLWNDHEVDGETTAYEGFRIWRVIEP